MKNFYKSKEYFFIHNETNYWLIIIKFNEKDFKGTGNYSVILDSSIITNDHLMEINSIKYYENKLLMFNIEFYINLMINEIKNDFTEQEFIEILEHVKFEAKLSNPELETKTL